MKVQAALGTEGTYTARLRAVNAPGRCLDLNDHRHGAGSGAAAHHPQVVIVATSVRSAPTMTWCQIIASANTAMRIPWLQVFVGS